MQASQEAKNKAVVRRFVEEVWNKGNLNVADEVLAPDYIEYPSVPDTPAKPVGPDGMKKFVMMFRQAFPDMVFSIDQIVAEEDRVAVQILGRGSHQGEMMGLAPTHRRVTVSGVAIHHLLDEKIVKTYQVVDRLSLREQLGVPQMGDMVAE